MQLAFVLGQTLAFSRGHIGKHDGGILAVGVLQRVGDLGPVWRPYKIGDGQVLGRSFGYVLHLARRDIHDINFPIWRCLGFYQVGQALAIRRPCGIGLGNFRRARQVGGLAAAGADQKDVPLLVAVVVRGEDDPLAVGRPRRRALALVADCDLHRRAALGRHQPEVPAPADVADEDDALTVGRPCRPPDKIAHEKLVEGELLHVGLAAADDLLRISDGLGFILGQTGSDH